MKINFTEESLQNLSDVADYLYEQTHSKAITLKHILIIKNFIKTYLNDFPKLGRAAEEYGAGVRKLVFQRYSILYVIQESHIDILSIYKENLPNL